MKPSCSSSLVVHRQWERWEQEWNQYLLRSPAGNFYQRSEWLRINEEVLGHDVFGLCAEDDGEIVGVLPLVRVRSRLFGDILSSMPFVNSGGPVSSGPAVQAALLREARGLAAELGCDYVEVRSHRSFEGWIESSHKVSMTVPLCADPEELFASYSSKHRRNVRRSLKNGIRVESGGAELMEHFFSVMESGWRALGTPLYHRGYFEAIARAFPQDTRLFVGFRGETPIAAAFNGVFADTVEGMWAAVEPKAEPLMPNYVLYWHMIEWACRAGYRRFHLGRSTAGSGAETFKRKWGAEPMPLFWNYHLEGRSDLPSLNPDNPRFRLAIRAWQRLPLPLLRLVGPPIARLIP